MRATRRTVAAALVALAAGSATACTGDGTPSHGSGPQLETIACPDDVEVLVVPVHHCGYVVPDPGSDRRVFVVVVEPPTPSDRSPVLETGTDLGMTPGYGGLAPVAQRTGRRTVIVDLPGTGHSTPSLDCPEVEALGDPAAGHDISGLTSAVEACRDRIVAAGVDPLQLTPSRLGDDLYAVMRAFDAPRWVVMGHGTTAEAGRQVALAHPDRVEALVMDSPVMGRGELATENDRVVADVAAECSRDTTCRGTYGNVQRAWGQARRRLARTPLQVEGRDGMVTVDETALERAVRWLVAPAAIGPGKLPALLAEAASGRPGTYVRLFADTVSGAPPLCVGYLPKCESGQRLVIGAVLSALCPELAGLETWTGPCEAWGVTASETKVQPLRGVPTLALYGALDPFVSADVVRSTLAQRVPGAFVVEQAAGGHNVLASDTARAVRNDWLAGDPTQPPAAAPDMSDPPDFTS
jgi:pimeloyl-ACP methyl ester carboxylesterase